LNPKKGFRPNKTHDDDCYRRGKLKNTMKTMIQICLFASLKAFTPKDSDNYPIGSGTTVRAVMERIGVPLDMTKIIFINGKKGTLDQRLTGGERVGIFPPVAGG
jgi:sulfur-carrier protein